MIIGNPPYVEFPSKNVQYSFDKLQTSECGNLYGCCIERALDISLDNEKFSFIVPVAISCSKRMNDVISILKAKSEVVYFSHYDDRPGKLFEMIEHLRACIIISSKKQEKGLSIILISQRGDLTDMLVKVNDNNLASLFFGGLKSCGNSFF